MLADGCGPQNDWKRYRCDVGLGKDIDFDVACLKGCVDLVLIQPNPPDPDCASSHAAGATLTRASVPEPVPGLAPSTIIWPFQPDAVAGVSAVEHGEINGGARMPTRGWSI